MVDMKLHVAETVYSKPDRPRYVQVSTYKDGTEYYRYNPDRLYVDEGLVKREVLGTDKTAAYAQAIEYNRLIDEFIVGEDLKRGDSSGTFNQTVGSLVDEYLISPHYLDLIQNTQKAYKYCLDILLDFELSYNGKFMGAVRDINFEDLSNGMAQRIYDQILIQSRTKGDGITFANHVNSVAKRVWTIANKWELTHRNPWKFVETKTARVRRNKWSPEKVGRFLSTAFAKESWYNIGVIVHLGYATSLRNGDCRTTTWDELPFDKQLLHKVTNKRGKYFHTAEVQIPLDNETLDLLKTQYEKWGHTEWVAPNPLTGKPYSLGHLSKTFRRVADAAELPRDLQHRDLRRTVLTELADTGSTNQEMMSWSGHANASSLKPYLTNTVRQATSAFQKRKANVDKKVVDK